jgi:hypothetical protein
LQVLGIPWPRTQVQTASASSILNCYNFDYFQCTELGYVAILAGSACKFTLFWVCLCPMAAGAPAAQAAKTAKKVSSGTSTKAVKIRTKVCRLSGV